ncbi:MAG: hypothetical protein A2498_01500 [Lentisphaerae bacterium RIFOXYC12_FULL_60_16]|nr:MAG: hypothetical protein A2498_01500 [Lentisphaerae bacterium RIFOXYC12_FULL_60_16]OGV74034.1 MAG: hypothetical protein A2269_01510 [Lentisphaerae bacterium RIFOXYA12_FULL_60_10]OGV86822.1 MAG: hypothetical protein A2340_09145 [Lentisphaerae bacterium RIFOXYB12_FULL_60_10]
MNSWALQDAKAKFSAVVERAQSEGPQLVTRHGEDTVVVVAAEQFHRLTRRHGQDLIHFFHDSPLSDLDPEWLRRKDDAGRELTL